MNGGIINKIKVFLQLIRFSNIAFLLYLQGAIFWLLSQQGVLEEYACTSYALIIGLPTSFILSFGYAHNDLLDIKSDYENDKRLISKGLISSQNVRSIVILLFIFFSLSVTISNWISPNPTLLLVYIGSLISLFFYNINLKCRPILGNLVISTLSLLGVFSPLLLQLSDNISHSSLIELRYFLIHFGSLVFLYTLMREVVKDIEDINGDRKVNCNTIPAKYGIEKSRTLLHFLFFAIALLMASWMYYSVPLFKIMIFVFAIVPFIGFILIFAKSQKYDRLSAMLKTQMLLASLLVFLFTIPL